MTTTRLTIRDLKRAAKTVGAHVERDTTGRWETYQVIAPDGHVWACAGDIHMIKVEWLTGDADHRHEAIKDAVERIAYGTEPCQDDECDFCGEAQ